MDKIKRFANMLMSSALFWIFFIVGSMILFIVRFEQPVNLLVNKNYRIF